ncbi:MAG: FAD-binding oxidoreductase [Planctomycetes bacterium]|nr:FAD-binding oxidoreductase [Planctomycetota bacterium]
MSATTCVLDGFGPLDVARPGSVNELGDLIRAATALYPFGGKTQMGLGNAPTRPGVAVDLRGLAEVIDFPARDMTITVEAGMTLERLRGILEPENLRLPIDVPESTRATLGGVLAANVSGARRYGYGTLRDYVIGISALNDEGNVFKAGGRVVKNVAGYDLCKLLVGSLGTLGIITQVTLKLRPLAEQQALICLPSDAAQLEAILTSLSDSRTRPVCIEVLNRSAANCVFGQAALKAPAAPWIVLVGYEGNGDAVSWQVQQLVKEVGAHFGLQARIDFTTHSLCCALTEYASTAACALTFRASLPPSRTAAFCLQADRDAPQSAVRAHGGNGIVHGHWPGDLTKEQAASILTTWRERAAQVRGSVIVQRCAHPWKQSLDVWGPPTNDIRLMREVKAKFDPRSIFNPGRFVDGI